MVELESQGEVSRGEVAAFLRQLANEIDNGVLEGHADPVEEPHESEAEGERSEPKRVTFIVGGDSATVSVPQTVEFDVEVASRSPLLSANVYQAIELHLSWALEEPEDRGESGIEIG